MVAISTRDIAQCYLLIRKLDVTQSQYQTRVKARNLLCMHNNNLAFFFLSCTMHFDTIESFIYPTVAQLDCSKYIKIYMRAAPTYMFQFFSTIIRELLYVLC